MLKWLAVAIICLLAGLQFIRPVRSNPAVTASQGVEAHLQMNEEVKAVLDRSCGDCHSNKTRWPWYSNVAPVSWFVIDHVNHGRSHLNFSEWGRYDRREAEELLGAMCKEVQAGTMPMSSYTRIHRDARMSPEEVRIVCDWTTGQRARIAARY